jgi:hypothetical protein
MLSRLLLRSFAVFGLLVGCSAATTDTSSDAGQSETDGSTPGVDAGTDRSTSTTGATLNDGYKKATWASNVTVTYGDCTLTYVSNGLPNHSRDAEYALPNMGVMVPGAATAYAAADPTVAQRYSFTINTCKTIATDGTKTSLGNIGYMISGAGLFNPYEGDGSTVALGSNFSVKNTSGTDVYFVDACNGHPTPMGLYHYHGLPACVTSQVDAANGPSHIIGIAVDGYPIYGNRDIDGNEISGEKLDACNGITSATPEFPGGVYHYVLLNTKDGSSAMRCTKGK